MYQGNRNKPVSSGSIAGQQKKPKCYTREEIHVEKTVRYAINSYAEILNQEMMAQSRSPEFVNGRKSSQKEALPVKGADREQSAKTPSSGYSSEGDNVEEMDGEEGDRKCSYVAYRSTSKA